MARISKATKAKAATKTGKVQATDMIQKELSVTIQRWYDKTRAEIQADEKELNVLLSDFQTSQIPFDGVRFISGDLVRNVVNQAKDNFNRQYMPPSVREYHNKEFAKTIQKYVPIADRICNLLMKYESVRIEKTEGNICHFNNDDIETRCNDCATYRFSPIETEYFHIIGKVAKSLNDARQWEREHGFLPFVGIDTADTTSDGMLYYKGFCTRLLADNKDVFTFTTEQFAILLSYGIIGKYGNSEKTLQTE